MDLFKNASKSMPWERSNEPTKLLGARGLSHLCATTPTSARLEWRDESGEAGNSEVGRMCYTNAHCEIENTSTI